MPKGHLPKDTLVSRTIIQQRTASKDRILAEGLSRLEGDVTNEAAIWEIHLYWEIMVSL